MAPFSPGEKPNNVLIQKNSELLRKIQQKIACYPSNRMNIVNCRSKKRNFDQIWGDNSGNRQSPPKKIRKTQNLLLKKSLKRKRCFTNDPPEKWIFSAYGDETPNLKNWAYLYTGDRSYSTNLMKRIFLVTDLLVADSSFQEKDYSGYRSVSDNLVQVSSEVIVFVIHNQGTVNLETTFVVHLLKFYRNFGDGMEIKVNLFKRSQDFVTCFLTTTLVSSLVECITCMSMICKFIITIFQNWFWNDVNLEASDERNLRQLLSHTKPRLLRGTPFSHAMMGFNLEVPLILTTPFVSKFNNQNRRKTDKNQAIRRSQAKLFVLRNTKHRGVTTLSIMKIGPKIELINSLLEVNFNALRNNKSISKKILVVMGVWDSSSESIVWTRLLNCDYCCGDWFFSRPWMVSSYSCFVCMSVANKILGYWLYLLKVFVISGDGDFPLISPQDLAVESSRWKVELWTHQGSTGSMMNSISTVFSQPNTEIWGIWFLAAAVNLLIVYLRDLWRFFVLTTLKHGKSLFINLSSRMNGETLSEKNSPETHSPFRSLEPRGYTRMSIRKNKQLNIEKIYNSMGYLYACKSSLVLFEMSQYFINEVPDKWILFPFTTVFKWMMVTSCLRILGYQIRAFGPNFLDDLILRCLVISNWNRIVKLFSCCRVFGDWIWNWDSAFLNQLSRVTTLSLVLVISTSLVLVISTDGCWSGTLHTAPVTCVEGRTDSSSTKSPALRSSKPIFDFFFLKRLFLLRWICDSYNYCLLQGFSDFSFLNDLVHSWMVCLRLPYPSASVSGFKNLGASTQVHSDEAVASHHLTVPSASASGSKKFGASTHERSDDAMTSSFPLHSWVAASSLGIVPSSPCLGLFLVFESFLLYILLLVCTLLTYFAGVCIIKVNRELVEEADWLAKQASHRL